MKKICLLIIVLTIGFAEQSYAVNAEAWELFEPRIDEELLIIFFKFSSLRDSLKGFQKDLIIFNFNFIQNQCESDKQEHASKDKCIEDLTNKTATPNETGSVTLVAPKDKYGIESVTLDKKDKRHIAFFSVGTNNITPLDILSRYGPSNTRVVTDANFKKRIIVDCSKSDKFSIPIESARGCVLIFSFDKESHLSNVIRTWDDYDNAKVTKPKKKK